MRKTIELLKSLAEQGEKNDRLVSERNKKYLNITHDTGEFLSVMVKAISAKKTLEIGTSNGYSTIWLADAHDETGGVITIECNSNKVREANINFEKAMLDDRITLIEGDANEILPQLKESFDLVFLDADRNLYMNIVEDLLRLTKPGGIIICDNATSHYDELKNFIAFFNNRKGYSTCLVPIGKGEFVVYKGANA